MGVAAGLQQPLALLRSCAARVPLMLLTSAVHRSGSGHAHWQNFSGADIAVY